MLRMFNSYQCSKAHVESKFRTFLLVDNFLGFEKNSLVQWLPIVYIIK
jgi:hypothetical protein